MPKNEETGLQKRINNAEIEDSNGMKRPMDGRTICELSLKYFIRQQMIM